MDVTSSAPLHPSDRLRREPTAPVVFLLLLAAIPYLTGSLIVQVPGLRRAAVRFAQSPTRLLTAASVLAAVTAVLVLGDLLRTRQPPPLRLALRIVRSLAYASLLTAALYLAVLSQQRAAPGWMPSAWKAEAFWVTAFVLLSGAVYALALHPWGDPGSRRSVLTPYQNVVASLRDTYDFVLGIGYPDDELRAASGRKAWALLPHQALWTNLFVFGGVGSGKTSRNAYPLVQQAIGKHPQNDALRPSIVMLDLKGDNAEQVYRFAKQLGRAEEFWCIAPGNALPQENGRDIIPKDRFLTWNPVGGTDASDIRALQLYDAFEATNEAPSHQYFKDVQSEFLTSTIQLFDVVDGVGKVTLLDLYKFGLDASTRANLIAEARNLPSLEAKGAVAYFDGKFNQLPPKDQSALISGLTAKLAKLSSPTLQSTFCQPDGGENAFTSFHDLVVNHPGIVVFSVPDSLYSEELSRLLGIAFLRRFQTQQLERSTTAFRARGGNVDRLVLNVVDECWAYMNAKIASFTAVSRQSKTCCLFLSQSLDQIGEQYRETVIGNFRSKVLLGVNDLLTLKTFSAVFGEEERDVEVESVGESLQQVRQGVLGDVDARSRGMTASRSIQKRTMPRYSLTDLQELGGGRGVFHLFDGQDQHKPRTIEFCPWYRLPYFLFHPLAHPDVHCRQGGPRAHHEYVPDQQAFICATCGHQIDDKATRDLQDYQANHPELLSGAFAMSGPVKLNARDLRLLAFLGEKKGAPLDVLGHRFFATDPRTGAENKHPVRACARRISTLTAAGYLAQSDLDEGLVDGQRSTMVSLAAKGAKRIGARVRRIHARHFDHHVVTIRVCEAERRRLLAAGAAEADYRLEHEFMADAYAGEHRTKGTTFDAFPDAVLTVDDGAGPYRVAVEYVTRAYTDGQIAEKSATFSGFADVLWVADGAGTAGRVEHITHQECITA